MSGNASIYGVDRSLTLTNGKNKWIPVSVDSDGNIVINVGAGAGIDVTNDVIVMEQGQFPYEVIASSQTDQILGGTGAAGDYLQRLICVCTTATGTAVSIKDGGGSSIPVLPTGLAVPAYFNIPINAVSMSGAWQVTTGANVVVMAVGRFSA